MVFTIALAALTQGVLMDPAYRELSKLVGGDWYSRPDANTVIHQHFEFGVEGKVIRGTGDVKVGGKTVLYIHSNMGWDPVSKSVTYVDFHNHDTIYMGHITAGSDGLKYDFNEFADPKKHYAATCKFTDKDHYQFIVGKEALTMTRS
jgi:hypothetical protein